MLPAPPPPSPAVKRSTVALWAAGVAVVAAGAGTAFGVLALTNKSAYDKGPTYSNADDGNDFAAYADGAFALAVAAGVTSVVLFLTSETPPDGGANAAAKKASASFSASPILVPHGGGAGALLRF